jgi:hypothetical protein
VTRQTSRITIAACIAIGVLYFVKAIYRGLTFTRGDFYFTMPGEYAQRLNPALWTSPDLQQALGYNHGWYLYGPTQYMTLYPMVFLPTYESIAAALLVVYPFVLAAAFYVLWRLVSFKETAPAVLAAATFAMVFAFLPLTQALIQREFEVVAFLALALACLQLVRGRDVEAGALVAYLTWFKYWPVILLGVFVVQRRVRGLVAFAVASAVILLAAQLVFGLRHFVIGKTTLTIGGLLRPLGSGEVLLPVIPEGAGKSDFCRQWIWGRGTQADVRWALCSLEYRVPAFPAKAAFISLIAGIAGVFLWGAFRLGAHPSADAAKWASIWEFSILTVVGSSFIHAHYYYLIVFLLPLAALLFWYATRPQPARIAKVIAWGVAYVVLNAFVVPTSWLTRVLARDAWEAYLNSGVYLAGMLLLLALLLVEFVGLSARASHAPATV